MPDFSFEVATDHFVKRLDALEAILPVLVHGMLKLRDETGDRLETFIQTHGQKDPDDEGQYLLPLDKTLQYRRLDKRYTSLDAASKVLSQNVIVSMVSQFDLLVAQLIRGVFSVKPEALNASNKTLTYSQVVEFPNLEAVKEHIIEKEVETVLRDSHAEQFTWFENKLGIPLRNPLPVWPEFIEISERRNLFVHTDGIVSAQYLAVCKQHGVAFDPVPALGTQLTADNRYARNAYRVLFQLGVKLAQTTWRKLQPEMQREADEHLNQVCFELLKFEEFETAVSLLEFAVNGLSHFRKGNEYDHYFRINLAQAYKWSNCADKCRDCMTAVDWSQMREKYRIADAVLRDDFVEAANIVREIGKEGEIGKRDYAGWPLFREFRKSKEFLEAFERVFGEPFGAAEEYNRLAFIKETFEPAHEYRSENKEAPPPT